MFKPISVVAMFALLCAKAPAGDRLNILDFALPGSHVDRTGKVDASAALAGAISAANAKTERGEPACVYVPPGFYRIVSRLPSFLRAGCVVGDGSSQSILSVDPSFAGDLFSWSEAWVITTPGPRVVGLRVVGDKSTANVQNAFVFYDRNDQVYMNDVDVWYLHGRVLYSGMKKNAPSAYMRESHLRSLRFFEDGAPGAPVIEFNSQGSGQTDATNEIRMSQVDIYGSRGSSFVIRNEGSGKVRNITVDALRIEGLENGQISADLLTIGDPTMTGGVSNVTLTNLELIDPYERHAALRITAPPNVPAPYQITVHGSIGGGAPAGQGLRIDAGRELVFHLSGIHTFGTNVVVGAHIAEMVLDGGGQEARWTYQIDPTSLNGIFFQYFDRAFRQAKGQNNFYEAPIRTFWRCGQLVTRAPTETTSRGAYSNVARIRLYYISYGFIKA